MKKLGLVLVAMLFVAFAVNAQVKFGIKAGLNLANTNTKMNGDKVEDIKMKPGFHLGVTAELALGESLSLEPGLLFSTKGNIMESNVDVLGVKIETKTTTNVNYLELPINFKYGVALGSSKLYFAAGPYFGLAVSGKTKVDVNGDKEDSDLEIGSDKDKDDIKAMDMGVNVGAGVEFGSISVGLQYGIGLANIIPGGDSDNKSSNNVLGISIGFKIGGSAE